MNDCLEFHIDDESWRDVSGIVRLEDYELVLEFRTNTLGFFKSKVQELRLPLSEVALAELQYRLLYSYLKLQLRSLRYLNDFPGLKGASLRLKVKGIKSRNAVRAFVSELNYLRAIAPSL